MTQGHWTHAAPKKWSRKPNWNQKRGREIKEDETGTGGTENCFNNKRGTIQIFYFTF